jgi:hypothetical protein
VLQQDKGGDNMRIRMFFEALIALVLANSSMCSQTADPLSFFPHHRGDIWEYQEYPSGISQNRIITDSLGQDGRYYIQTTMSGALRIDTVACEVHGNSWGGPLYSNLTYKLAADSGDSWTVAHFGGATMMARVATVFQSLVLGEAVTVKQVDFVDSASGLLFNTDYLASDFGLIGQDNDGFIARRIRGTLINGVQHGTITSANQVATLVPNSPVLHQNYPNPFNPHTTIQFALAEETYVELTVFDLVGRRLKTLLEGYCHAGTYSTSFDGSHLSSGVYVYALNTKYGVLIKKMLLIR